MNATSPGSLAELERRIGHRFLDRRLLQTALTHRSFAHEHPKEGLGSNERLEFLGDAVLGLAVGHLLMEAYPDKPEGALSRWRANLVNEGRLAEKARKMGLGSMLLLGRGEERTRGRQKSSLLADAYEAVVAAVYLDGGFDKALEFVRRQFRQDMAGGIMGIADRDFKTRLQEYTQSVLKITPRYTLKAEEGPDHDKRFHVELNLGGGLKSSGLGRSKKEAEQEAAREMLSRLAASSGNAQDPDAGDPDTLVP